MHTVRFANCCDLFFFDTSNFFPNRSELHHSSNRKIPPRASFMDNIVYMNVIIVPYIKQFGAPFSSVQLSSLCDWHKCQKTISFVGPGIQMTTFVHTRAHANIKIELLRAQELHYSDYCVYGLSQWETTLTNVNTFRPGQIRHHFAGESFKCISFSWMNMYWFRLLFRWIVFPRTQLTIFQHWFT